MASYKKYQTARGTTVRDYRQNLSDDLRSMARVRKFSARSAKASAGYTRTSGYYGRFAGRNAELKFFDTTLSFNIDQTGEVPATGQLVLIPQGVTESTRVGRKCVIKSIYIKATMSFAPGAGTTTAGTGCMVLVQDTQCNGAAAAVTDVYTGTNIPVAMHNLSNSQRFKVLKVFKYSFNPQAGVSTAWANITRNFSYYKKCNIPLEFSSTTGAITEIRSNNLFLIAGTEFAAMDDLIGVSGTCRVRFSDGS